MKTNLKPSFVAKNDIIKKAAVLFMLSVPISTYASTLIISEVMVNPNGVSDLAGEWFEIFNASSSAIDLNGLVVSDDGADTFTMSGLGLVINSGEYFVLGNNGDSSVNGGYAPDYVYSNFNLSNSSDEIVLSSGGAEIFRLNYDSSWITAGKSMELAQGEGSSMTPTPDRSLYQDTPGSLTTLTSGDYGTPGTQGTFGMRVDTPAVPVPGAVWLFGSGLIGLIGVARRKKV